MASSWILRTHPRSAPKHRIFCFPFAGGGASLFRTWSDLLPNEIEVCGIQPPGREMRMREDPLTRMSDVADQALEAMRPLLELPFSLYGHSLGALTAFEVAHRLQESDGSDAAHLFVSARRAPDLPNNAPPIHALSMQQFMNALRLRYQGIPKFVFEDKGMREMFFPVLRADMEILETYACADRARLQCPITTFGGASDQHASAAELEAWRIHTAGDFAQHTLPGGHFFVREDPRGMLSILKAVL